MKEREPLKKFYGYDIEQTPNFHSCVFINVDDPTDKYIFVIHETRDDSAKYYDFLINNCSALLGFNNIAYDYPLLHYFMQTMEDLPNISTKKRLDLLYSKSTYLVESKSYNIVREVRIPQVDLFRIYHLNNKARICGLKFIQISLGWHNVQDMPYHHTHRVKANEINEFLSYNINDVESTIFFYDYAVRTGEIEKRKVLSNLYDANFTNYSDVAIGDYINKVSYMNASGKHDFNFRNAGTKRASIALKDCIPPNVNFRTAYFNQFLFQLRKVSIENTKGEFEHHLHFGDKEYHMKTGGLHSVDSPKIIEPQEGQKLYELDVGSMYPSIMCAYRYYPKHLGEEFIDGFDKLRLRRLKAKKLKKTDKTEAFLEKGLKLSLNGLYGKTNDKYSWVYDPQTTMSVTITGQLFLLMLIERCVLAGFQVLSANTDGIYIIIDDKDQEILDNIVKEWMNETKLVLDQVSFSKLVMSNVNNYIAVEVGGSVKLKGWFEIVKPPYKKHTMEIVKEAWLKYFTAGIPIETTILECDDILKFCIPAKMKRGWTMVKQTYNDTTNYYDEVKLQKTNRYFISKAGSIILKKHDDGRVSEIQKGYLATILNKYDESKNISEYEINYQYYFDEAYKIIRELEPPKEQMTLF